MAYISINNIRIEIVLFHFNSLSHPPPLLDGPFHFCSCSKGEKNAFEKKNSFPYICVGSKHLDVLLAILFNIISWLIFQNEIEDPFIG